MSKTWGVTHCPMCEKPLAQDEDWLQLEPREDVCWSYPLYQCCDSTIEECLIEVITERDKLADHIANLNYLNLGIPCEKCGSTDGWVCGWCEFES